MRHKVLFSLAVVGVLLGLVSAYVFSRTKPAEPPVFNPAPNPYATGIYANGIVESYQANGENINLYPEVGGTVVEVPVKEGQAARKGDVLVRLDDSVQRATAEQLRAQAEAAESLLEEIKAQPRKETLEVSRAQVDAAAASLKNVQDQLAKIRRSYRLNRKSVSRDALDTATNTVKIAEANLAVARRQYELTRAGAWSYDIKNQERQAEALSKSATAAEAVLAKYTLRAPVDGTVLSVNVTAGSYVSAQGAYGTYTQGLRPVVVMGASTEYLAVRCFVDEILVNRLPPPERITGQMSIRGTTQRIELEFVRIQPYVTPKIELSDQRLERVDVRVLPVIFRFKRPKDLHVFPGQLADVYIGEGPPAEPSRVPAGKPKGDGT